MTLPRCLIAVPNLAEQAAGQFRQAFNCHNQSRARGWEICFTNPSEMRHHDYARNGITQQVLDGKFDKVLWWDADVVPPDNVLELLDSPHDVVSGIVFCWIRNKLLPSVWSRAECEECVVVKKFQENDEISDPTQYYREGPQLWRWNPFSQCFQVVYDRTAGSYIPPFRCHCQGSGWDPWVFRVNQQVYFSKDPFKTDSAGAACLCVSRKVFESMKMPYWSFLYKNTREIMLTEDHYFCWKAGLAGYEVWCDPKVVCGHQKMVDLLGVNQQILDAQKFVLEQYQSSLEKKVEEPRIIVPPSIITGGI